jgi:hypothetical protein
MTMASSIKGPLRRFDIPVGVKLSGLWAAVMFCYAYADLLGLWLPGALARISSGELGPIGSASPGVLASIAVCMAIPSVMVALSLLLAPWPNRVLNVLLGLIYTAIMAATIPAGPLFYKVFGVTEVIMTLSIAWLAVRWPHEPA